MKQIFEQYASSMVAIWIALILFTVVGNGFFFGKQGIQQVLGAILEYSIGEKTILENGVFKEHMSGAAPIITERNTYIVVNKCTLLSDCFSAKTIDGKELSVFLEDAWDLQGKKVDLGVSADRMTICAKETGVYWVQVCAIGPNQKKCSWVTRILANER